MVSSYTLDTNCLIAVEEDRPEKPAVLALVDAAFHGRINVAMVASSASERQIGGERLDNIGDFIERMKRLGFGHIKLLKPIAAYDVSFWDYAIFATPDQSALQDRIFRCLFPTTDPSWTVYAVSEGVNPEQVPSAANWRWRNRLLDVQAIWAHIEYGREIFVTSDANFRKRLTTDNGFPGVTIETPQQATSTFLS